MFGSLTQKKRRYLNTFIKQMKFVSVLTALLAISLTYSLSSARN